MRIYIWRGILLLSYHHQQCSLRHHPHNRHNHGNIIYDYNHHHGHNQGRIRWWWRKRSRNGKTTVRASMICTLRTKRHDPGNQRVSGKILYCTVSAYTTEAKGCLNSQILMIFLKIFQRGGGSLPIQKNIFQFFVFWILLLESPCSSVRNKILAASYISNDHVDHYHLCTMRHDHDDHHHLCTMRHDHDDHPTPRILLTVRSFVPICYMHRI